MLSAQELHQRARDATNAGRHRRAHALVLQALDRAPEALRPLLHGTLAYVETELGNPRRGLELCDAALADPRIDDQTRSIVLGQRALIHVRLGDRQQAMHDFTGAITALDGQPEYAGRSLLNRGNLLLERGLVAEAELDFAHAAEQFGRAGMDVQRAKAVHNVGYAALLAGDLVRALRLMDEARDVLAPLSTISRAVGEQDRAEALFAAGLLREGVASLRDAAHLFGQRKIRRAQAEAEFVLARHLISENPREAARLARRAHRRFHDMGAEIAALRCLAVATACELAMGRGDLAGVRALMGTLRRRGLRHEADVVLTQWCGYLVGKGRLSEASAIRLPSCDTLSMRLLVHGVAARRADALGRPVTALDRLKRGLEDLSSYQATLGSLDLQTSVSARATALSAHGLALAVRSGRPGLVYLWAERARALASRIVAVSARVDPAITAQLAELRLLMAQHPDPGSPAAQRIDDLIATVRTLAWRETGSAKVVEVRELGEIRDELALCGAVLVAHMVVDGRVVALVIGPTRETLVDLGDAASVLSPLPGLAADLDLVASALPSRVVATVRAGLDERLRRLDEALLAPLRRRLGDARLVLTPSSALTAVPWTLLDGCAGRAVTVPRSATTWFRGRGRPWSRDELRWVGAVGGSQPVRADAEAGIVAACWQDAQVRTAGEATVAATLDLAEHCDVLHVAAHGNHVAENPLFSNLWLADGPLYGYDLDRLARVPALVVLSSCEVGATAIRPGEESISMTTVWLRAGSRAVIAATAALPDEEAVDFMAALHVHIAGGLTPADALAAVTADRPDLRLPLICRGSGF